MLKYIVNIFSFLLFTFQAYTQDGGKPFEWIIELTQEMQPIGKPSKNQVVVKQGQSIFLFNLDGDKQVMPYDSMSYAYESVWKTWRSGLQGYYHIEKGELIPPVYESISPINKVEGNWVFKVSNYGMNAYINEKNQPIIPYHMGSYKVQIVGDTILSFGRKETKYISRNGHNIRPSKAELFMPQFKHISNEKYVYKTLRNGKIHQDTFAEVQSFKMDIAAIKKGTRWGYLHKDGRVLIKPIFQAAQAFNELGQAIVKQNDQYGVINKKGDFIIPPSYPFLKPFKPGVFEYKENGQIGLIDSKGDIIVPAGPYKGFLKAGTECYLAKSGDSLLVFNNNQLITNESIVSNTRSAYAASFIIGKRNTLHKSNSYKRDKGTKGLMSSNGEWLIQPELEGKIIETENFLIVEAVLKTCCQIGQFNIKSNQPQKFLIMDWQGKHLLDRLVDRVNSKTTEPFMIYQINKKHGLIDLQKNHLPAEYDKLQFVGNGWIYVKKGNQFGVIKWK